jgi:PIN domain nuclease of toxin-antitoxin system
MDSRILLDTNAYLRLAEVFHPLLKTTIKGVDGGEIWILSELYRELERSPRLRVQFSWASNPEFIQNRKLCSWRLPKEVRSEIDRTYHFGLRLSQQLGNGASSDDIRCLAYGVVLGVRVVTDDQDMTALGEELEVDMLSTLALLELFVKNNYCDMEKVRSTVRYWIATDDLPARYADEFRARFGEAPPTSAY